MPKTVRLSIFILIFFLVVSLAFGFYSLLQKQRLEKEKDNLRGELSSSQTREKEYIVKIKNLEDEVKTAGEQKAELSRQLADAKQQAQDLLGQIDEVSNDRDEWKKELDTIKKERDDLAAKLDDVTKAAAGPGSTETAQTASEGTAGDIDPSKIPSITDREYWASILRQKAALEVEVNKFKEELSKHMVTLVDLKEQNAKFEIELESLRRTKEDMITELKNKEEMADNLSLELARAKNDRKFAADTIEKLNNENVELRDRMKDLLSAKGQLEKSIILLSGDKNKLEKKLAQMEGLIQEKIEEVWGIKNNLNQKFTASSESKAVDSPRKADADLQLPPIVVSQGVQKDSAAEEGKGVGEGQILSVNEDNNFVIIGLGENSGIRAGDTLNVYRGGQYIALLRIIQVRKDISAADIKEQTTRLQVGDSVK